MKIFFDLDGTLLNDRGVLSLDTVNDLKKLSNDGYEIIIATARPYFGVKHLIKYFSFMDTLITSQGATVLKKTRKQKFSIVNNETIDSQTLNKLLNLLNPVNKELWFFNSNSWYTTKKSLLTIKEAGYLHQSPKTFTSIKCLKPKTTKIIVPSPTPATLLIMKKLNICNSELSNNGRYLEITKRGINKATWLKSNEKNTSKTVIVVGDSDNDICLFEIAKTSISVSNSSQTIKASTDYTFERSPSKGIVNLRGQFHNIGI